MKEDLLHFIWRCGKLQGLPLTTTTSEHIAIRKPGTLNKYAGPDFFNAVIEVGGQLWAGNVEMHLKSSDWYAHHHETDDNYNNVILHVVWEHDIAVFRKDGSKIPVLQLKEHVPEKLLAKYNDLFSNLSTNFINCEKDFDTINVFLVENWYHRLFIERLEQKSDLILELLEKSKNDWEGVLFKMLARNFASKLNGGFFLDKVMGLDFSVIRKTANNTTQLESLLFGHFGLLENETCKDQYYLRLKMEYEYLAQKFGLEPTMDKPKFFGLRPANFPTIRVSQLANLYIGNQNLFAHLMQTTTLDTFYDIFDAAASSYWNDHYTFGKVSRKSKKKLSKSFVDLLVINTILPLKFCYSMHLGQDWSNGLLSLAQQIKKETNVIIDGFGNLGSKTKNALESQAKIQLYNNYCSKNKCLQCNLGAHLLNRNT
ncbi:MAG: DUF2851 family protein [Flavobacteriaceae bacterium]